MNRHAIQPTIAAAGAAFGFGRVSVVGLGGLAGNGLRPSRRANP